MLRRPIAAALALAALASAACGRGGAAPPERHLPADVHHAIVLPDAGRAARGLAALEPLLARIPGAPDVKGVRAALAAQLGLDPLDPDALRRAGLEPRRGAALAEVPLPGGGAAALLALPVRDRGRVDALVTRLAEARLGAVHRTVLPDGAVVFRRQAGDPAALAYRVVEGNALVAAGPQAPAVVARAAGLPEDAALGASASWRTARKALGADTVAWLLVPPGSPRLVPFPEVRDGLALGLSGSASGVSASAAVLLGSRAAALRALDGDGTGARTLGRLDPVAAVAARYDGQPAELGRRLLPLLSPEAHAWLASRRIEPQELTDLLAPGAAATAGPAPVAGGAPLPPAALLDAPLRLVRIEAVLPVRDVPRALALSERLGERPPAPAGATAGAPERFGLRLAGGEIAWVVDAGGSRIAAAAGPVGTLDALVARLGGDGAGFEPATRGSRAALEGGLGGAVLDPRRVVAGVRGLPPEAFGGGPSGFVARSVAQRLVAPLGSFSAISVRAEREDEALVVRLLAELQRGGGR